jgi:hypothetical protein
MKWWQDLMKSWSLWGKSQNLMLSVWSNDIFISWAHSTDAGQNTLVNILDKYGNKFILKNITPLTMDESPETELHKLWTSVPDKLNIRYRSKIADETLMVPTDGGEESWRPLWLMNPTLNKILMNENSKK